MTRRLGRGDAQKGRARLALLLVSGITAVLILGLTPGGSLLPLFAAPTGSPTSTTTETAAPANGATPTTGAAPTIKWINPSAYEDPEVISNAQDANATYHLVVSVGNVPPNPDVLFQVFTPSDLNNAVTQIVPVRIGATDVWEANWAVNVADGDYVLRARLISSNATPGTVATDDEAVTVDSDDNGNDIEAAEINYPVNGGPLGTYDPPGTTNRGFIVEAKTSAGASGINVYYSTSPPGTDPNWRECDSQVTISYSSNDRQIGCTAAANVGPADITAVAAAATGTEDFNPVPSPNCVPEDQTLQCPTVDAGDAHRVAAYDQIPTSLAVLPFTSNNGVNTCRELVATAVDQQSSPRPIYRANIDVHATGPLDGTKFGKSPRTSPYKPPDAGGHDSNESTANCGTAPAGGDTEGVHIHATTADDKHIESTTGTDPNGTFVFALRSPDQGTTNVSAFIDQIDDDLASGDPTGTATITWGPAASVSGSASGSASASASTSASGSATGTQTASSSASSTSGQASRSITLEPSKPKTKFGKKVTLSGAVTSSNSSCISGQTVKIQRSTSGGSFADFGTATTTSGGTYSFDFIADQNASYRATVDASSSCGAATSATRNVLVKVAVSLTASDHSVKKRKTVEFHIHVNPCGNHAGTTVVLLRNTGHGYKEIGQKQLNGKCNATFRTKVKRDANYKARWPGQDDDHETGTSRRQHVEVTNDGN